MSSTCRLGRIWLPPNTVIVPLLTAWFVRMLTDRSRRVRGVYPQMVAGRMTYHHPCGQKRDYIIQKLIRFSTDHDIKSDQLLRNLGAAVARLPRSAHREEAATLAEELARVQKQRGAGPQRLGEILPAVLAKLGVSTVESTASGETDPT